MLAGGLEDGRGACDVDGDGDGLIPSLDRPTGYAAGMHDPIYIKSVAQIMNGLDIAHVAPTAEWVARQITEAFPWDEAPHYLIRDRDRIYGSVVTRRLRAGHPGQAYRTSLALAEWLCRTADRIDSKGVSGSCGDLGRGAFASDPEILCWLLQRD
jgi:hypothetical protein